MDQIFQNLITITKICKTIYNNCSQIIKLLVIIAVNEQDNRFYGTIFKNKYTNSKCKSMRYYLQHARQTKDQSYCNSLMCSRLMFF